MESEAIKAVEMAAERVLVIVRGKHALRGDSWLQMRELTMADLVKTKSQRVLRLYEHPKNVTVKKELEEELADIIAYSAFQLYLIEKGKP